ncbi:P-loop containing nucleoside triphosphate hydrolase protein [Leucogyrophana mollusca]|uniref:P-loop containing nucleoside triphosphate hydrolase protein n=1 Tax=Leucogyrophana mollusca TaxID=85980 RepID=A0ACB8BGN9_9AGAM|nr:P-loop containing nucleoside triphosphate hydrolase protein [Leucogyrophana mollusca]
MVRICPQLEAHGVCTIAQCPEYHEVKTCELCGVFCASFAWYEAHIAGKKHRRKAAGSNTTLHCSVCNVYIYGQRVWEQHVLGGPHAKKALQQGLSPAVEPTIPDTLPGRVFCSVCDKHIPEGLWSSHSQSFDHRKKEGYGAYKAALREAEKDKHGVIVSGDADFGVVEILDAKNGVSRSLTIQTTVPSSRFTIVSTNFSSPITSAPSPFTVELPNHGPMLVYGRPIAATISVRLPHAGRAEDRLEILFEDTILKQRFVIVRPVTVIVGSRADYELLKPKAPYIPRQRTARQPENDVVPGIKPPSSMVIPYVGRLPKALPPTDLVAALSEQSTSKAIGHIQRIFLPKALDTNTYARHFKALLWVEEFRMERDLEHYDILDALLRDKPTFDIERRAGGKLIAITRRDPYYYVDVPGLAEKRPSVLVGDRILVQKCGAAEGRWYEGGVHVVHKTEVGLRFHASFMSGWSSQQRYTVRFKLNRIPVQRQHQALDTAFAPRRVLFPSRSDMLLGQSLLAVSIKPFNGLIATNAPQLLAVTSIMRQQPGSPPFVVFGPPGTGKTITIVEAIKQLLHRNPTARILATAPSNSAADLIAERLVSTLNADELFRLYAPSRYKNQVPDQLQPYTFMKDQHFSTPPMSRFKRFRVIVCTCVSASIPYGIGVPRGHFSHIFADEAGQATEPEVMIGINTMSDNSTNIILSGDPKQLGPIIRSGVARELGLETSYLERLMGTSTYDAKDGSGATVVKLVKNFRSHPTILKFPNERFYAADLEPCGDKKVIDAFIGYPKLPSKKFPIIFHAVSGKDDREASSPSFFNIDEVTQVKTYIKELRDERRFRTTDADIGVITPYHAQCLKIRTALKAVADEVKVGSVEEFQGQERKVIIISTVRSSRNFVEYDLKHTLGFVANPRRFNVAITRAQALLIVVGDPSVLSLDPLWRSFLNYVHQNRGWAGPPPTWDTSIPVDENGGFDKGTRETGLLDMNSFSRRIEKLTLSRVQDESDEDGVEESDANVDREWRDVE